MVPPSRDETHSSPQPRQAWARKRYDEKDEGEKSNRATDDLVERRVQCRGFTYTHVRVCFIAHSAVVARRPGAAGSMALDSRGQVLTLCTSFEILGFLPSSLHLDLAKSYVQQSPRRAGEVTRRLTDRREGRVSSSPLWWLEESM